MPVAANLTPTGVWLYGSVVRLAGPTPVESPPPRSLQRRVGADVGTRCRSGAAAVPQWCPSGAAGLTDGGLLEEFEIPHGAAGFGDFFARIEGRPKH